MHVIRLTCARFIPTCVGNTWKSSTSKSSASVHPHVRGEYDYFTTARPWAQGSSPRAWGILNEPHLGVIHARFIPTCVGNTAARGIDESARTVHPHVRGEYSWVARPHSLRAGSSPRAWGIQNPSEILTGQSRFIPTCVGNTYASKANFLINPVHPHVRGEYSRDDATSVKADGSSPRAWGIQQDQRAHRQHDGFIPTCVGNTSVAGVISRTSSVHPHVRGEYSFSQVGARRMCGSSPRAWGIHLPSNTVLGKFRFIPTCVGNTPSI